jgi:MFS transporter, ACS family, solute carrier family 17 (sodium-dependent inorganic phosphate cotransporter), other
MDLITRRRLLPWPKRLDVSILCFLGLLIATCDRVNISVAAPSMMREYGWNTARMGVVLSAFYTGYVCFMIPAGVLADRIGPKRLFAVGMSCWSALTALTSVPRSLGLLITVRGSMGAGESITLPAMNSILARWFPPTEYSRIAGLSWSGGYGGPILAFPVASLILRVWGWRAIFYLFAGLGLVWLLLWHYAVYDRPEDCGTIGKDELRYIRSSRPDIANRTATPWPLILLAPEAWAVFLLHFSSNWFTYFLMSWLPTYLLIDRHFSLDRMALGSTLPFICALFATNVFAHFIDRLRKTRGRTFVSKMFVIPFGVASATLILASRASSPIVIVSLLCLSATLMTSATPVYASGSLDLLPAFAGSFVGVQNAIANLAGLLAPAVTGYLVAVTGWSAAFSCTTGVCALGIAFYLLFGRAE